jgi:hypothetical protein
MLHLCVWQVLVIALATGPSSSQDVVPPHDVKVLPVSFVPADEHAPTNDQNQRLMHHLDWCRTRYRQLLGDQVTFSLAEQKPRIYRSARPLGFYRNQPEASAPQVASELLTDLKYNRYNCPYVLLAVMMNRKDDFPSGGGRPLNGGYNTGGGIIVLSSFALDHFPNFQSTLQHELGHTFGLPHVNVYGYDMQSNDSIMSYNPRHHTRGFKPSPTPGKLIPEDLRGLALNTRVFPDLRFDPQKDVPRGYSIAPRIVPLGPMQIPGQFDPVQVTTDSGEDYGSKAANIVRGPIVPSKKAGKIVFDPKTMWQSAKAEKGWVSVQVAFPCEVELTRVAVHSQHSGEYHAAQAIRVAVQRADGRFREIHQADLKSVDETVRLPQPTTARAWRFSFRAGKSGCVVLRGLRFFSGADELFPPLVPP